MSFPPSKSIEFESESKLSPSVFFLANRLRTCIIGLSELDITLGNVEKVGKVSFDSKEELARTKTTDLVIVEKEGITDVILEAAKRYRIA